MRIEIFTGERGALLRLFQLAEDSPTALAAYIDLGTVLVARDDESGAPPKDYLGHVQILDRDAAGICEIKSLAVREDRQGQGIGGALIDAALAHCRELGAARVILTTAMADIGNLRFYQRLGFRMTRIVPDAFGPAQGYAPGIMIDGIPLRDQVVLEMDLGGRSEP